jgi:hypothetical protein
MRRDERKQPPVSAQERIGWALERLLLACEALAKASEHDLRLRVASVNQRYREYMSARAVMRDRVERRNTVRAS